jgi:hypothetical protein
LAPYSPQKFWKKSSADEDVTKELQGYSIQYNIE